MAQLLARFNGTAAPTHSPTHSRDYIVGVMGVLVNKTREELEQNKLQSILFSSSTSTLALVLLLFLRGGGNFQQGIETPTTVQVINSCAGESEVDGGGGCVTGSISLKCPKLQRQKEEEEEVKVSLQMKR